MAHGEEESDPLKAVARSRRQIAVEKLLGKKNFSRKAGIINILCVGAPLSWVYCNPKPLANYAAGSHLLEICRTNSKQAY